MSKTILGILQNAETVPLGCAMWESEAEYQKYVKVIKATINECADRVEAYAYMSPNFMALAEELRAIGNKT